MILIICIFIILFLPVIVILIRGQPSSPVSHTPVFYSYDVNDEDEKASYVPYYHQSTSSGCKTYDYDDDPDDYDRDVDDFDDDDDDNDW